MGVTFFSSLKNKVEEISHIMVEVDEKEETLILFSNTNEKYQRKHLNLYLRAAVSVVFITMVKLDRIR